MTLNTDLANSTLYQVLVETSPDAIILVAPNGTIEVANAQAAMLHGLESADDLRGSNLFGLIAREEHQSAMQQLDTTMAVGFVKNVEYNLLKADGSEFPAELSMSVIRNSDGTPQAFIGVVRDITERKLAHKQIEMLLETVQQTNQELEMAYDTTLKGWTGALDLRDKETEGHSQRVTSLTLQLTRALGNYEDDIVNLWRGALLHDIGKMGVPDSILLKPGPLTDTEWKVMKMHPLYAKRLLEPISFLRPAIDIPYYHHEKWDGTGYPCGLKGEEIPVAARIFAVVDVWDALCSNRPYRRAMPEAIARDYIYQQSGKHFDPVVVEAFMKLNLKYYHQQDTGPLDAIAFEDEFYAKF